jgi:hypothetical protein
MAHDVFPDLEAVARKKLADANITNLSTRVYSSVPGNPTYSLATVRRIGGIPVEKHRLDRANIQVDVWGTSKSVAQDIAQAARAALHDLEGTKVTDPVTAFVSSVQDSLGLTWLPDPQTGKDRYTFAVYMVAHS